MAGLIKLGMGKGAGNVLDDDPVGIDPQKRSIDPSTETVLGQVTKVTDSGSPLIDRARTRAAQTANSRGLLNSSIAAGAGEAAAIDAALPIAMADANVYGAASRDNQQATNASLGYNAGAVNAVQGAKIGAELEKGLIGSRAGAEERLTKVRGEVDRALQTLRGEQATALANVEGNYRQLIQANASAGSFFQNSMNAMAAILGDVNTSAEQKQGAVARMTQLLESGLHIIGATANLDLAGLLDFRRA